MRQRTSLLGKWHYNPLAYVTITEHGAWHMDNTQLPPAGTMTIPAHWERQGVCGFAGTIRFERSFVLPTLEKQTSLWLVCCGVDYFAKVFLNGKQVSSHEGYFQTWEVNITHVTHPGENTIAIEVTCPLEEPGTVWGDHKRMIKGILSHWDCRPGGWNLATGQDIHSGGIWNDLFWEVRPAAFIRHVKTQTSLTPPEHLLSQKLFIHNEMNDAIYDARVQITTELDLSSYVPSEMPLWLEVHID